MSFSKRWYEELSGRGFGTAEAESVCMQCVTGDALRTELCDDLDFYTCSFCGRSVDEAAEDPIAASFDSLMYAVMRGVHFLYVSFDESGAKWDEGDLIGGPLTDSYDVAYEVCEGQVSDAVLDVVQRTIDPEQWAESHISESPLDVALRWGWEAFQRKVMHESRFVFLSRTEESSGHPDDFTTEGLLRRIEKIILVNDLLVTVTAGQRYWRGRLVGSESQVSDYMSAASLGSPPANRASNSRMSPAGISVFYGSLDVETVVAEIGAHSTLKHAVVGQFETIRDLKFLNLVDLPVLPSIFADATLPQTYFERKFLRTFAADIAKPIALDGREHIEYVPTQVLMEYLRYVPEFDVHGVLFKSAQNEGVNCIIFADASACVNAEPSDRPAWRDRDKELLRLCPETVRRVRLVVAVES